MTRQQAEAILQRCSGRVDLTTGKVFDHVILEGWFDADEIQAVLALLRAETQQDEGMGSQHLSGERLAKL